MRLADLACDVSYGYTASATDNPVGPKFLRITDIAQERLDWDAVPFCTISDAASAKHQLQSGDIVIARTGATVGYSKYLASPPDSVYASYLVRVRVAADYNSQYVGYVVGSREYKDFILANAGGAAQPNANAKVLSSYPVPVPPLPTQHKIASILTAYDDLIENNTHRIKLLEEMAQAIYREWFVEFRYPGHEKVRFVESELGPIPQGWEVIPVGDVIQVVGGGTPSKGVAEYWDPARITWFTPTDLTRASAMFMLDSAVQISELGLAKSSARLFSPGAVMMTSRATIGVVSITTVPATTNQGFITCFPTDDIGTYRLYWWLVDHREEITSLASGATFKEINKKTFRRIPFLRGPRQIERQFEVQVEPLALEILMLMKMCRGLREARDLLLPRLISGEIDVEDLDIDTAELAA
jgi:type I restriction enzyme, S subunit